MDASAVYGMEAPADGRGAVPGKGKPQEGKKKSTSYRCAHGADAALLRWHVSLTPLAGDGTLTAQSRTGKTASAPASASERA